MRRTIPAAALVIVILRVVVLAANNWPHWRGPELNGLSKEAGPVGASSHSVYGPPHLPPGAFAKNALNDYCLRSTAVSEGQIFLRTSKHLWVIGDRKK